MNWRFSCEHLVFIIFHRSKPVIKVLICLFSDIIDTNVYRIADRTHKNAKSISESTGKSAQFLEKSEWFVNNV